MEIGQGQGRSGGSGGGGGEEHVDVGDTSGEPANANHGSNNTDQFLDDILAIDQYREVMNMPIKKRMRRQNKRECPSPSKRSKIAPALPAPPQQLPLSISSLGTGASTSSTVTSATTGTGGTMRKAGVRVASSSSSSSLTGRVSRIAPGLPAPPLPPPLSSPRTSTSTSSTVTSATTLTTGGTMRKAGVVSSSLAGGVGGIRSDFTSIPIAARVLCPPRPLVPVSVRPLAPVTYPSARPRILLPARLPAPLIAPGTPISLLRPPVVADKNNSLNSIANGMSTSGGLPKTVCSTPLIVAPARPGVSLLSDPPSPVNHAIHQLTDHSVRHMIIKTARTVELPVVVKPKPPVSVPSIQPDLPSQLLANALTMNSVPVVPVPTSGCRATPTNLSKLSASRPEITITPITSTVTATSTFVPTRWNAPEVTQDFSNDNPVPNTPVASQNHITLAPTPVTVPLPSNNENENSTMTSSSISTQTSTLTLTDDVSTQTDPERFENAVLPIVTTTEPPPYPSSQPTENEQPNPDLDTNDNDNWPMLVPVGESGTVDGSPGAKSSKFLAEAEALILNDEGNWRSKLTTSERFKYSLKKHDSQHDVIFKIGSGDATAKFHAYRLLLIVSCGLFKGDIGVGGRHGCSSTMAYEFPDLDPDAFRIALAFLYTGKLNNNAMGKISKIMTVAKTVGCQDLIVKCTSLLRETISPDNAVELYHLSLVNEDGALRSYALTYITRNPRSVLFSDGFLKISIQALNDVLICDDWYLHELDVFEAVKRWAEANTLQENFETMGTDEKGAQLRAALGDVLYSIRFLSLDYVDWVKTINVDNPGLFTTNEIIEFVMHLSNKSSSRPPPPPKFNVRPRHKRNSSPGPSSTTNEYGVPDSALTENDSDISNELTDDHRLSSSEVNKIEDSIEPISSPSPSTVELSEPPKKKQKRSKKLSAVKNNTDTSTSHQPSVTKVPTTSDVNVGLELLAKDLSISSYAKHIYENEEYFKRASAMKARLTLANIPTARVYMPNLKEVSLDLYPTKPKQHGSSLKSFLKGKFSSLWDILFVNVDIKASANQSGGTENSVHILSELLLHKVNISITCEDVKMFSINHDAGLLLMNLIKDAQKVINACGNFPLKTLALGDCDITSLNPLNRELLEVIVMRRVKGLKNHSSFLMGCTKLREVSWNDLGSEEINLSQHLLDNSTSLSKLALAKCNLTLPLASTIAQQQNTLQELYLDNCDYEPNLVSSLPSLFPFVSRVQIYGRKCDSILLHSILNMESIKFIFVWELAYFYVDGRKKRIQCPASKKVQTFLAGVFDESYAKNEKNTFILERKSCCDFAESSSALTPPSTLFNSRYWNGRKLMKDKFEEVNKQDYEHYSYRTFFPTYESFRFFDSTEKDAKKKKGVQNVSAPDLVNSDSNMSNTSNANADSTDML